MNTVESYWLSYLASHKLPGDTPFSGEISFGCNQYMSAELTALVLTGQKRATCTPLEYFEITNEKLPHKGSIYVITDWGGNPCGVLAVTAVHILPYKDVPWEMAQKEGEDADMASWIQNHNESFQ